MINKDFSRPSEAELEIVKVLWESSTGLLSAPEIVEKLKEKNIKWKKPTIYTLIDRLAKKKVIKQEKVGRLYYYSPCISKEEYKKMEAISVLNKLFDGSVKNMVETLIESADVDKEELEAIRKLLAKGE